MKLQSLHHFLKLLANKVELPENTVNEIIATLAKSAAPQQRAATSPSNSDRPKMKATKPPETLADISPKWLTDLFSKWFGKKPEIKRPPSGPPDRGNKKKKR